MADTTDELIKIYLKSRNNLINIIKDSNSSIAKKEYSAQLLKQVETELTRLRGKSSKWTKTHIKYEYEKSLKQSEDYFLKNKIPFTSSKEFATLHTDAINILANEMTHNIGSGIANVGRRIQTYSDGTDDALRQISLSKTAEAMGSGQTAMDLKHNLIEGFTNNNIFNVIYANGTNVPLEVYANMVARSTMREATNFATINQLTTNDYDLVQVSSHYPTCAICATYQLRVFSISGNDKRFPKLSTIFPDGYFNIHPNCRHIIAPYIESMKTPEEVKQDIENSKDLTDNRDNKEKKLYNEQQSYQRQARADLYQYRQYKEILGSDIPGSYSAFRRMKKNESEIYENIKGFYRTALQMQKNGVKYKCHMGNNEFLVDMKKQEIKGFRKHFYDNLSSKSDRVSMTENKAKEILENSKLIIYQKNSKTYKYLSDDGYVVLNFDEEVVTGVPQKWRKKYNKYLGDD